MADRRGRKPARPRTAVRPEGAIADFWPDQAFGDVGVRGERIVLARACTTEVRTMHRRVSPPKPRADDALERPHLRFRHLVSTADHALGAGTRCRRRPPLARAIVVPRSAPAIRTARMHQRPVARGPPGWRRILRCVQLEPGFPEPLKFATLDTREMVTRYEPASHPLRANLCVVAKTEGHHEHHRETVQRPPCPLRPFLQMTPGSARRRRMQADKQERAVGHFAASSIMRGPAASRYTGVGVALRFLSRVGVGPNATSSPASNLRRSLIASRMNATPPRGFRCFASR